ncbi:MAG: hypothetical protein KIS61_11260 [Candidatus Eremiobacteraeota bacterium]|nr:hypothetical protein [Candidatus Eremiobacteraeota bacterium]
MGRLLELFPQFFQVVGIFLLSGLSDGHQTGGVAVKTVLDRVQPGFGLLQEDLASGPGFALEFLAVLLLALQARGAELGEFGPVAFPVGQRLHQFQNLIGLL